MPNLSSIGEKELIRTIILPLFSSNKIEVGVGDDAAVINIADEISLVVTIDRIPDNLIGYKYGVMNEKHLGRYLAVANLSDLAAMGAKPIAMLTSLVLPNDFDIIKLRDLLEGINEEAIKYGAPVVGGDTKGGPFRSFTITALGIIQPGTALTRKGAKVGDKIFVTGQPGLFGTALAYLLAARPAGFTLPPEQEQFMFKTFTEPTSRINEGILLRTIGCVHGCQDISDGLGQTVLEIAEASGTGFQLNKEDLLELASREALSISQSCQINIEDIILGPGADFELVFGVPPTDVPLIEEAFSKKGWAISCIGEFTDSGYFIIDKQGKKIKPPQGFSHFSGLSDDNKIRDVYFPVEDRDS